jgi:hypothetical protein
MLGWATKTLARRQHDEFLKSIHRVWHYIPEAPGDVSFCILKFLSRLADVNFERVIEHLSKSDIVIVDGSRISRKPGLAAYQLVDGSELPDRMQRTLLERQDAKSNLDPEQQQGSAEKLAESKDRSVEGQETAQASFVVR